MMEYILDKDLLSQNNDMVKAISKKEYKRSLNDVPKRTLLEEIGNAVTHGVGTLAGIIMLTLMVKNSSGTFEFISALVYGISIIIMMLMSCLYHSFGSKTKVKRLFRRFDYSSIYLLIGGTYAPILLLLVGGDLGLIVFIVQWLLIITGITFVSVFGPGRLKFLHFSLYFVIGWGGALFTPLYNGNHNGLLFWILLGGLVYTFGMIPFFMKKSNCAHFIWHFFVLVGCILQWIGIYLYLF